MSDERVRCTVDGQGVAEVVLARPDKMNALDAAMFDALAAVQARLQDEPGLRAVVLHGEGRAFCAGLDTSGFAAMAGGGGAFGDITARTHGLANLWQQAAWGWRMLPVPVVAAVQGVAYGGGLQVALGADVRLLHPQARLSVMELQWGIVPDMAGFVLLTELLRADVLRDLVYTARVVEAPEAVALGLGTRVEADPLAAARAWAAQVAGRNPEAVRAAKRLALGASPVRAAEVLLAESREQQALIGSPNQAEAVRAAQERRPPVFR